VKGGKMIDEKDQKYGDIVKLLKGLQQVKAPNNFEANLMRKINAEEYTEEKTGNWLSRIFVPKRFIPSAALAVAAVLILFVIKPGSTEIENPFNTQPRMRKDMITTSTQLSAEKKVDKELQKMIEKNKTRKSGIAKNETQNKSEFSTKNFQTDKPGSSYASQGYEDVSAQAFSGFYGIEKSGLNFRQVNLSKTEKMELNRLKENLIRFMKENKLK
jgi:hypothetical protein